MQESILLTMTSTQGLASAECLIESASPLLPEVQREEDGIARPLAWLLLQSRTFKEEGTRIAVSNFLTVIDFISRLLSSLQWKSRGFYDTQP